MTHRRLDQATFQALQALIGRGTLRVSAELARAIRARREEIGASAATVAHHFGAGADQIEEIEGGGCEISAPMLVRLARVLEVDLVWFVERDPSLLTQATPARPLDVSQVAFKIGEVALDAAEGLDLMRAFLAIKDPEARKAVLDLARRLAASEPLNEDDEPQF